MSRVRTCAVLVGVIGLAVGMSSSVATQSDAERPKRIALWGSSVPNGTGDELNLGGYTGRLRELLEPRGWEVLNRSRGGDNTVTIAPRFEPEATPDPDTRYLTTVHPGYVVIALSLGNEGIKRCAPGEDSRRCVASQDAGDALSLQFVDGMQALIRRSRERGIEPVVGLNYARGDFTEFEYGHVRRMNLLMNTWDVPSINFLGAIDDGHGRWARGFFPEPIHPNAAGHTEMFHAIVPTLFDAIAAGKPIPTTASAPGFARVRGGRRAPLTLHVDDTLRSFGFSFLVRSDGDGTIAGIGGETVDHEVAWRTVPTPRGDREFEAMTLSPSGRRFQATINLVGGRWVYAAAGGNTVTSPAPGANGRWHHVVLTHYVARGRTHFYVDGRLVGTIAERLQPDRFVLGGPGPDWSTAVAAQADYKEWMVHRAGLNRDEVAALHNGTLLQASLELYAPMSLTETDDAFANRAQSLSTIVVDSRSVTPAVD